MTMNAPVSLFNRDCANQNIDCHTMLRIERFCCCCTLRMGSFIIGYLGLMSYCIQVVAGSVQFAFVRDEYHYANHTIQTSIFYYYYSQIASMAIAYNAFLTLTYALLVWGIHKAKSEFILPWLVVKVVNFILVIAVIVFTIVRYVQVQGASNVGFFIILAIFAFCIWLSVYTYACVFSHYKELKSKETRMDGSVPPPYNITVHDEKKEHL